jgi:hypothetical protein
MAKSIQFHPAFHHRLDAHDEQFAAGSGVGNAPVMMGVPDA